MFSRNNMREISGKPSASVIIPAYNAARFIGRTIDSILNQDRAPSEIIVVNDGSTDDTVSAVSAYGRAIKLINIENGGPTGARLTGVKAATSWWLAFCDSDDLWHPDHLSSLLDLVEAHNVPFAFSNFTHIKDGQKAGRSHFECDPNDFWVKPGRPVGKESFVAEVPLFSQVLRYQAIFPSCTILNRAFFERIGGLNPLLGRNVSEDLEFTLRCVKEKPTGIVVRPTVDVCRHEQNYTIDWIRTVAGSIDILKYARDNHGLCKKDIEYLEHEIISRSLRAIDSCFTQRRFEDVSTFAKNLSRADMPLKTAIKTAISNQPRTLALLLWKVLTAGSTGASLRKLLRKAGAPA
jgi:glycosyltransferase involved in cell wall biosynthesis